MRVPAGFPTLHPNCQIISASFGYLELSCIALSLPINQITYSSAHYISLKQKGWKQFPSLLGRLFIRVIEDDEVPISYKLHYLSLEQKREEKLLRSSKIGCNHQTSELHKPESIKHIKEQLQRS